MAHNLNYHTNSGSWCYMDSSSYCGKYGRLYDWKTAKKACPAGWRLPSRKEWVRLSLAVGGVRTARPTGWSCVFPL
ncbi:FISUMP domain-containing protein, partial [Treponema sp. R8-4-B8]